MIDNTTLDLIARYMLLMGIMIASIYAINLKNLIAATIASSIVSILLALQFYMLHAPDVALAEGVVGAGVMTAIFVITISKTKQMEEEA